MNKKALYVLIALVLVGLIGWQVKSSSSEESSAKLRATQKLNPQVSLQAKQPVVIGGRTLIAVLPNNLWGAPVEGQPSEGANESNGGGSDTSAACQACRQQYAQCTRGVDRMSETAQGELSECSRDYSSCASSVCEGGW